MTFFFNPLNYPLSQNLPQVKNLEISHFSKISLLQLLIWLKTVIEKCDMKSTNCQIEAIIPIEQHLHRPQHIERSWDNLQWFKISELYSNEKSYWLWKYRLCFIERYIQVFSLGNNRVINVLDKKKAISTFRTKNILENDCLSRNWCSSVRTFLDTCLHRN